MSVRDLELPPIPSLQPLTIFLRVISFYPYRECILVLEEREGYLTNRKPGCKLTDIMREKNINALIEGIHEKVDAIMTDFEDFLDGTRVLLLLQRAKESGHNKEHKRRRARFVTHGDPEQIKRSLFELLLMQAISTVDYRVYLSAAPRDLVKAEMHFKKTMLDVDFTGNENKRFFYEHIEDKWISALMSSNPIQGRNVFVLDIDQENNSDALKRVAEHNIEVLKLYKTKNGWHIVVKPFNRTLWDEKLGEVKNDGLLLLSY